MTSIARCAMGALRLFALLGVCWGGWGCDDSESSAPDAAADVPPDGYCAPASVAGFRPTWKPPRSLPRACTATQIDTEYKQCVGATSYNAACSAFHRDLANATCRSCLVSTEDETSYGPLIILRNRLDRVNVPGCLALVDGDRGDHGCGAAAQALDECTLLACTSQCLTLDGFRKCTIEARDTVCQSFVDTSPCSEPSIYAACIEPTTFDELFHSVSNVFCGSALAPAGGSDLLRPDRRNQAQRDWMGSWLGQSVQEAGPGR